MVLIIRDKMNNYVELDKNFNVEKINDEEFNFYPYTALNLKVSRGTKQIKNYTDFHLTLCQN